MRLLKLLLKAPAAERVLEPEILPPAVIPVAGLLADPGLATQLSDAPSQGDGGVLAAQRTVAETAMIAAELIPEWKMVANQLGNSS